MFHPFNFIWCNCYTKVDVPHAAHPLHFHLDCVSLALSPSASRPPALAPTVLQVERPTEATASLLYAYFRVHAADRFNNTAAYRPSVFTAVECVAVPARLPDREDVVPAVVTVTQETLKGQFAMSWLVRTAAPLPNVRSEEGGHHAGDLQRDMPVAHTASVYGRADAERRRAAHRVSSLALSLSSPPPLSPLTLSHASH
jgi:hypothetical protein